MTRGPGPHGASMATLLVRFPRGAQFPLGGTPMAIGPGHLWAAPARGLGYPRLAQGKMIFAATTLPDTRHG